MWAAVAARLLPMVLEGAGASKTAAVASNISKGSNMLSAAQHKSGGSQQQSSGYTPAEGAGATQAYSGTY